MKKLILFLFLFVIHTNTNAQGVLSLPDMNILYRGYENILQLGTANYRKPVTLAYNNVSLTPTDLDTNTYIARVNGSSKEAIIWVVSKNLRDTLATFKFRIRNLPTPELFFGETEDGGILDSIPSVIHCKYGEQSFGPQSMAFSVLCYELIIEGAETTYKGPGNTLNTEAINALNAARTKPRKEEFLHITVQTKVKGSDGITRNKAGVFLLK